MNILAIGAHFDDVELGCGGSLAKHVDRNDSVFVYVATVSGFTNHKNDKVRSNATALSEGQHAMDILGVSEMFTGQFDTLAVEFVDELNVEILKIVEEKSIDLVYTHWPGDVHHDHQAVAKASLHSCRHVPRLLVYRSNWYHSAQIFRDNFYVDISDHWETKKASILAHKSEVERTKYKWIEFFQNEARNAGQRIGTKYAEAFEVVKWLQA